MIALDELKSTINRLGILMSNSESIEEKLMANLLITNLSEMYKQAEMIANSSQFKQQVQQEEQKGKPDDRQDG